MEYEIVEKEEIKLVGLDYHGSITENKVAFEEKVEDLWRRLSEFCMKRCFRYLRLAYRRS